VAAAVAEGYRAFEATLEAKHLSTTSVNLDEEAVRLITLQRVYQASARYIRTLSELLDILVSL
jgi:flagellar hook-associated protein 1 FlgK